jgi:phage baseplate assembly protein gpV
MFGGILMSIKVGIVKNRNPAERTVRVSFPMEDNLISKELQVLRQSNDNWMPEMDEEVVVLFTDQSNGYVVGVI